jgi:hypothetical protein
LNKRLFVRRSMASAVMLVLLIPLFAPADQLPWRSECRIEVRGDYRYIDSNGIPNHSVGTFPNHGNPNSISPQTYHRRVPLHPTPAAGDTRGVDFGVAVNGVMFDPGTADLWNNDRRWHYEALSGEMVHHGSLGMDHNLAHVQPSGAYHYHGLPLGLLNSLNYKTKMVLVGWAADGYPIYGPFCYATADNAKSGLKDLKSSYRLKSGSRLGGHDGPGGRYDGSFSQDYEFVPGLGDLDEFNGRVGVTPEFPGGTFYYVLTSNWPFVPRKFKGEPDSSFRKGPPGGRSGGPVGAQGLGGSNDFGEPLDRSGGFGPTGRRPGPPPGRFPGDAPPGGGGQVGGPPGDAPLGGGMPNGGPPTRDMNGGPPEPGMNAPNGGTQ